MLADCTMLLQLAALWQCRLRWPKLETEALKCVTGSGRQLRALSLLKFLTVLCFSSCGLLLHSAGSLGSEEASVALLKLWELLEVKQDSWHAWLAVPALFAVFISCQKMSYNLFLLAFVLGIGGAFQYGLQVSIINSPAEVSMDCAKNWATSTDVNVLMCSCLYMQTLTFSLLLSKLDLLWFLNSKYNCYCSCVSWDFNFSLVWLGKGRMSDIYKVSHSPLTDLDCSRIFSFQWSGSPL